jgi:peptidoglycan-associated lipoprotein
MMKLNPQSKRRKIMLRTLLAVAIAAAFTVSCGSKQKKPEETTITSENADSPKIEESKMTFDAKGSDSGNIPGLFTVNFEYDDANLSPSAKENLSKNADWIKANTEMNIQVEGHCDERGSIEYNLALGERRAKATKAYLVSLGVDAGRLNLISYGKEKPLQSGDTDDVHSKNRRANFLPMPR